MRELNSPRCAHPDNIQANIPCFLVDPRIDTGESLGDTSPQFRKQCWVRHKLRILYSELRSAQLGVDFKGQRSAVDARLLQIDVRERLTELELFQKFKSVRHIDDGDHRSVLLRMKSTGREIVPIDDVSQERCGVSD